MIVYLDSMIVIHLVEGPGPFGIRARARLSRIATTGDETAISHLVRLECRVKPIRVSDASVLADYDAFFNAPNLLRFPLPEPVFDRATEIRAQYGFGLGDSLHLATAVEHRCGLFLTNDARLRLFPDITVEVLT
jgi:predicted nucleic acid-binding protein